MSLLLAMRMPVRRARKAINGRMVPSRSTKKIVVSAEGKTLLGGVLVGDAGDYATLLQMMLNGMPLPGQPESLILPALAGDAPKALGVAALPIQRKSALVITSVRPIYAGR